MWQMIGVLAELDRSMIIERTGAGIRAAKAQQVTHARALLDHGEQAESVASSLKVGRATLYRALQRAA